MGFQPTRRELIRFGLAGVGSLSLPGVLAAQSAAGVRKAVILLWCHGGPSHLETYDPKPEAPEEFRGPYPAIPSNVDGMRFSSLLPMHARIGHRMTLLRSFHHRGICHQQGLQTLLTGHEELVLKQKPDYPDAFCVIGKLREDRSPGIPAHVGIPPLPYGGSAYLGYAHEPFVVSGDPSAPKFEVPDIQLRGAQNPNRLDRRMRLRHSVDEVRRDLESVPQAASGDRHYSSAVELLTQNRARRAFDLTGEPEPMRDRYGRTRWGQSCLLARRLVEVGVSAVVVSFLAVENGIIGSWDDHAVNADCFKAMEQRAPVFDRAVTALIEDLHVRGMSDDVMVVVTGEFGRTPRINPAGTGRPGRDHWPHAFSVLVAGGGTRGGQVIGASDARGEYVDDRPLTPDDLLGTIYAHMGIDPRAEFQDRTGRPIPILAHPGRIPELY